MKAIRTGAKRKLWGFFSAKQLLVFVILLLTIQLAKAQFRQAIINTKEVHPEAVYTYCFIKLSAYSKPKDYNLVDDVPGKKNGKEQNLFINSGVMWLIMAGISCCSLRQVITKKKTDIASPEEEIYTVQ